MTTVTVRGTFRSYAVIGSETSYVRRYRFSRKHKLKFGGSRHSVLKKKKYIFTFDKNLQNMELKANDN